MIFEDLGTIDYKQAWDYQEKILNEIVSAKLNSGTVEKTVNRLLFCEHPHVYTLGKSGHENNLLIKESFLKSINATYYKINRGGDITYHGPGQIVGYPIFDLDALNMGIKSYIHKLEEAIIKTLAEYSIQSERLEGSTGVWLDVSEKAKTRKICAIGVRVSRAVTMHGFALNVNTDLNYFSYINPCGYVDKGVTTMEKELGKSMDMSQVKKKLRNNLEQQFGFFSEG
ncbi:MAG: lipoyl(octanoyl) transferase LipB [Bacteroidales bacterium]|nr:lipoyl(octanoyl) transferase LipB [Bacteroidales bacterium]